jgi:predicted ABC-type ATPase
MKKRLVIVGGANGVGKTTFAYQYRDEHGIEYLGADEIAAQISVAHGGAAELQAGKEFFRRLDKYFELSKSVIIESTLSGLGLAKRIETFKNAGYLVHIVYVFLAKPTLCKKRVAIRVKKGGHSVAEREIERRYYRSINNFKTIYMPLADTWQLFYNGLQRSIEVAFCESSAAMVVDEDYYRHFLEISV